MTTWNEATPAGTDYISGGDDIIRDFKAATRERLAREHAMLGSGDDAEDGKHRLAHGLAANRPEAVAGHVYIATDTLIVSVSPTDGVWINLRSDDPPGFVKLYAGSSAPSGWFICDGHAVSRTLFANLFAVIGTTYGIGDGVSTFNLPNFSGRVPVGVDTGQTEFDVLGEIGGAKTHTLTEAQLPSHTHGVNDPQHAHNAPSGQSFVTHASPNGTHGIGGGNALRLDQPSGAAATGISIQNTGGNGAHNNLQPYIAFNFVIKY